MKVTRLAAPSPAQTQRLGFMAVEINIPGDFDRMGAAEIERMFGLVP